MNYRAAVPVSATLCASCVHERRVAVAPPAAPTVWERQIRNAADAGDGDMAMKALRNRVAAEPNNGAARIELAKAYRERGYHEIALDVCRLAADVEGDLVIPAFAVRLRQLDARRAVVRLGRDPVTQGFHRHVAVTRIGGIADLALPDGRRGGRRHGHA